MTDAMMSDLGGDLTGSTALRVAVVGPCEAHEGEGIAHGTRLARRLAAAGHEVTLLRWAHQRPSLPDPAQLSASLRTSSTLYRSRPQSWVQAGRRLHDFDSVVVVLSSPFEGAALLCLLRAAGALPGQSGADGPRPRSMVVDLLRRSRSSSRSLSEGLLRPLLAGCDAVLVSDRSRADVARRLGALHVSVVGLPLVPLGAALTVPAAPSHAALVDLVDPVDPVDPALQPHPFPDQAGWGPVRLLLLRPARDRPEAERLLRAVRAVPGITLTVAVGPVGADRHLTSAIAAEPTLAARVEVRQGQVLEQTLTRLLAEHDVLVVAPKGATGDGTRVQSDGGDDVALAHAHGLAPLAPDMAPFSGQVVDGVDGLLVAEGSETALVEALRRLREPPLRARLGLGAHRLDLDTHWAHYLGTVEALSVDPRWVQGATVAPVAASEPVSTFASLRPSMRGRLPWAGKARRGAAGVRAGATPRVTRRGLVELSPTAISDAVRATDVLDAGEPGHARDAQRQASSLGLPRVRDEVGAWAALGALAAIVRVCHDGGRQAVIVDEGGPRSVFSRWARAAGLVPVTLGLTGRRPLRTALDAGPPDAGSFDAVVRIHPFGCDANDIGQVLEQAAWALRSRGLLVVTVPIGPPGADGALAPADVRGIMARAVDLGFVLVGDLDSGGTARMRQAAGRARAGDSAYGLVRLTLRRR